MNTEALIDSAPQTSGPGALLKKARESRGLHISVVATSLRVPVDRIRALEAEKWDELPDLVFARALTMSVCRQLKIDPSAILAGMPDPDPMRSVRVTAAISEPLGGVVDASANRQRAWWGLGLVLLLLIIVVALGLNADLDPRPSTSVETPEMPPTTEPPPPEAPAEGTAPSSALAPAALAAGMPAAPGVATSVPSAMALPAAAVATTPTAQVAPTVAPVATPSVTPSIAKP